MGCDIHAAIEFKKDGTWVPFLVPNRHAGDDFGDGPEPAMTPSLDIGRDYDLFAILGNVRNGSGFAGTDTGDGFEFITDSRGYPADIHPDTDKMAMSHEHSATWMTLEEILKFDWTRSTKSRGIVGAATFAQWDRVKEWSPVPDEWCGGVSGPGVTHITVEQMRERIETATKGLRGQEYRVALEEFKKRNANTYCLIEWPTSYTRAARQLWDKILPIMLKIGYEIGFENVRLVMDFDS